jgi:hypothetical protein
MLSRRLPLARSASAQAGDGAASPVKHRDGRSNIAVLGGFCCRGYGVGHGLLRPQSVERVRSRSIALRRSATATHSVKRRFRVGSRPSKRSRLIIKFLCDGFAKIMEMDRSNAPARCATRDGEQSQGDSAQRVLRKAHRRPHGSSCAAQQRNSSTFYTLCTVNWRRSTAASPKLAHFPHVIVAARLPLHQA